MKALILLVAAVAFVGLCATFAPKAQAKGEVNLSQIVTTESKTFVPKGTNPNCAWFREGVVYR